MVCLITEEAPAITCVRCGSWSETGKRTQLLKQCTSGFAEERKRAFDRTFKDGNSPNKNNKAKVRLVCVIDEDDEEVKEVRNN